MQHRVIVLDTTSLHIYFFCFAFYVVPFDIFAIFFSKNETNERTHAHTPLVFRIFQGVSLFRTAGTVRTAVQFSPRIYVRFRSVRFWYTSVRFGSLLYDSEFGGPIIRPGSVQFSSVRF